MTQFFLTSCDSGYNEVVCVQHQVLGSYCLGHTWHPGINYVYVCTYSNYRLVSEWSTTEAQVTLTENNIATVSSVSVCVRACLYVCVCVCGELCGLVVKAVDWQPKGARFNPHQPLLEKKDLLPWHPAQAQEK